jgi:hypothetical protein
MTRAKRKTLGDVDEGRDSRQESRGENISEQSEPPQALHGSPLVIRSQPLEQINYQASCVPRCGADDLGAFRACLRGAKLAPNGAAVRSFGRMAAWAWWDEEAL